MKIAYSYTTSSINFQKPDGALVHIHYSIDGLHRKGHDVAFIALQNRKVLLTKNPPLRETTNKEPISVLRTGISSTKLFNIIERGIRRLQTVLHLPYFSIFDNFRLFEFFKSYPHKFDIIHERYNSSSWGCALASRHLGLPYVLEINADIFEQAEYQNLSMNGLQRWLIKLTSNLCFNAADKIICVSPDIQNHLIREWHVNANKTVVLPCAADVDAFDRDFDQLKVRSELNLGDEQVVMWIGGFYPWHNVRMLVEIFPYVIKQISNVKLILIGDGKTRLEIQQMIIDKGLENNISLLGSVDHSKIPELVSVADVTVAPSIGYFPGHGGTPLKIFEYMAAGKAIVATNMKQISYVLQDKYNARIIEPDEDLHFAQVIVELLRDPEQRKRLGQAAKIQAMKKHSWVGYVELLEKLYEEIICFRQSTKELVMESCFRSKREEND